ncbi:unnamed protein product [Lathyrus sativus]|nr:unnamed protein product [Lathyrus sativus]
MIIMLSCYKENPLAFPSQIVCLDFNTISVSRNFRKEQRFELHNAKDRCKEYEMKTYSGLIRLIKCFHFSNNIGGDQAISSITLARKIC